jgi:hypothetical protein
VKVREGAEGAEMKIEIRNEEYFRYGNPFYGSCGELSFFVQFDKSPETPKYLVKNWNGIVAMDIADKNGEVVTNEFEDFSKVKEYLDNLAEKLAEKFAEKL